MFLAVYCCVASLKVFIWPPPMVEQVDLKIKDPKAEIEKKKRQLLLKQATKKLASQKTSN